MAFSVRISSVYYQENHYSNREVDELDEQKVNFKSQPNKEKSYLWILPVGHFIKLAYSILSGQGDTRARAGHKSLIFLLE